MDRTEARKRAEGRTDDEWMSLLAASMALSETRQTVLSRIVAGELEGKRVAGRTVVTIESVERVKAKK